MWALCYGIFLQACEIISQGPPRVVGDTAIECTEYGTAVIAIEDVNDNGPQFGQPAYVYYIYEDAQNGLALDDPKINIVDRDTVSGFNHNLLISYS